MWKTLNARTGLFRAFSASQIEVLLKDLTFPSSTMPILSNKQILPLLGPGGVAVDQRNIGESQAMYGYEDELAQVS